MTEGKDFSKVNIVFVLGGPGAGKGTLCTNLAKEHGFAHYSAGDLLRKEAKSGSEKGEILSAMMAEGKIVPSEVTISLLKKAIEETTHTDTVLIDGFPRNIDQGQEFENSITKSKFVLFLHAEQDIMQERILKRAQETGSARNDDNLHSLQKRFKTHFETCLPVIGHFKKQDKVVQVDASLPAQEVAELASNVFKLHL